MHKEYVKDRVLECKTNEWLTQTLENKKQQRFVSIENYTLNKEGHTRISDVLRNKGQEAFTPPLSGCL